MYKRQAYGDEQHQDGLGALGGHELSRLRQALERIAIEIRVLMAFLECCLLYTSCIVGVGQHGPHQRGQAQAPLRLPARNTDSVAWALFER